MKKQTVLQYLSTASDTFLIVAFAALVTLPFAVGLGVQPIKQEQQQSEQALAQAKSNVSKSLAMQETKLNTKVLGAEDTKVQQSPLTNVNVNFPQSPDAKKLIIDSSSSSISESSVAFTTKAAGNFDLLKISNTNPMPVKVTLSLTYVDSKASDITVLVDGKPVVVKNTESGKDQTSLHIEPSKDSTVAVTSTLKNLGKYKITAKISN